MRGRGAEFETVLGLLDGTKQDQSRVLLVEGEPGTRRSLQLAQAGEEAGLRRFRVVASAAGELSPTPSLGGLKALARVGPVLVQRDVQGPIWPPRGRSGPCHGCWRPIRYPGPWP